MCIRDSPSTDHCASSPWRTSKYTPPVSPPVFRSSSSRPIENFPFFQEMFPRLITVQHRPSRPLPLTSLALERREAGRGGQPTYRPSGTRSGGIVIVRPRTGAHESHDLWRGAVLRGGRGRPARPPPPPRAGAGGAAAGGRAAPAPRRGVLGRLLCGRPGRRARGRRARRRTRRASATSRRARGTRRREPARASGPAGRRNARADSKTGRTCQWRGAAAGSAGLR